MTVRALVGRFLDFCKLARAERTAEFYRIQLHKLTTQHGDLPAGDLRPWHVLALGPSWHFVLSVQRLYRWATDEADLLEVNPMLKLKRPRARSRRRVLSPAESAQLLRGARADFRRLLLAGRESAARPQELRELEWTMLVWEGAAAELRGQLLAGAACFVLAEYKGRSRRADPSAPRVIPISPRLGRLLWRLLSRGSSAGLVFKTAAGRPWDRNSVKCRMRRLLVRAGLAERRQGERIVFYTLRHTAATRFAAEGLQANALQQLLGHASIKTTARYVHLQRQQLLETWQRLYGNGRRDDKGPANP